MNHNACLCLCLVRDLTALWLSRGLAERGQEEEEENEQH